MNYSNLKCLYCNQLLTNKVDDIGFTKNVNPDKPVCQRCFRLLNYNELNNTNDISDLIDNQLQKIDFSMNNLIANVLDVTNLDNSIYYDLVQYQDKIIFFVNKVDYLPLSCNWENVLEFISQKLISAGFCNPKVLLVSINNKSSIKRLYKYLCSNYAFKKILFLGKTNIGKSSLINSLCKLDGLEPKLLISSYTNTTINLKQFKLKKFTIIDSPGLIDESNVCNYLDSKNIKKLILNKQIRPKNYFLNIDQTIMIEKIAFLSYVCGRKTNFTFYFSNEVKLNRIKTINLEKNLLNQNDSIKYIEYKNNPDWIEYEFKLDEHKKYNLSIVGLGLISINFGAQLVKIKVRKNIGVFLNEFAII